MSARLVEAQPEAEDRVGVGVDDVDEEGVALVQSDDWVRPLEVGLGRVQPGDAAGGQ